MFRVVASFSLIAACGALSNQRQPEDGRKLGQTDKAMMRNMEEGVSSDDGSINELAIAAIKAERAAAQALEAAQEAEAEAHSKTNFSEREIDAMDRRAKSEMRAEVGEEWNVEKVYKAIAHEADSDDRSAEDIERMSRLGVIDEERKMTEFQRELKKIDKEDQLEEDEGAVEKKTRHEVLGEHAEDTKLAHEKREGDRQLREAHSAVDAAKSKEKKYQKSRGDAQAEIRRGLMREADAMRVSASDGFLPETEILRLLDITPFVLDNITESILQSVTQNDTGNWYEEQLFRLRFKAASASSTMLEAITHKAEDFKNHHIDYDDHQLVRLLGKLLNDTKNEIRTLEQTSDSILTRLHGWDGGNPEKLTYPVAFALHGVTGNIEFRNHFLQANTDHLQDASTAEACDLLSNTFTSNVQPAYRTLMSMKGGIDSITKVVPSIMKNIPEFAQSLAVNHTTSVINMAYAEHLAFKGASDVLLHEVVPVVVRRFHCNFKSASARSALGLAGLVAAAALLGQ